MFTRLPAGDPPGEGAMKRCSLGSASAVLIVCAAAIGCREEKARSFVVDATPVVRKVPRWQTHLQGKQNPKEWVFGFWQYLDRLTAAYKERGKGWSWEEAFGPEGFGVSDDLVFLLPPDGGRKQYLGVEIHVPKAQQPGIAAGTERPPVKIEVIDLDGFACQIEMPQDLVLQLTVATRLMREERRRKETIRVVVHRETAAPAITEALAAIERAKWVSWDERFLAWDEEYFAKRRPVH